MRLFSRDKLKKDRPVQIAPTASDETFELTEETLYDFARGAAFLGTGGGGDPLIGRIIAQNAIREFGAPRVLPPEALDDDALVAMIAMLGAPTVIAEKGLAGDDLDLAIKRLEETLGRSIDALMPVEIGGVNSTLPIAAAARLGLPLVNADGMGRAFPEVQMVTMNFEGISATPFVVVDEHLNSAVLQTGDAGTAESLVRSLAIQMGLSCVVAGYSMTGAQLKTCTVPNTLTLALKVGRAIADGRKEGVPSEMLIQCLNDTPTYGFAKSLGRGKITDLLRETSRGFSIGTCIITPFEHGADQIKIKFQNENLIVEQGDAVLAMVPDLISIVDAETAEPLPVEAIRFGQRVEIIAASAPAILRTPQALKFVGPKCFGLDHDYQKLEDL